MKTSRSVVIYWVAFFVIFFTAGFMRMIDLAARPGYEWDESVYSSIEYNTVDVGYPALQPEGGQPLEAYLYHPPFDFYMRAAWMKLFNSKTVVAARTLSVLFSMMTYGVLFAVAWWIVDRKAALWVGMIMLSDGWLNYTNRLNLIENPQMFWITLAMAAYLLAMRKGRPWAFTAAGILLGWGIIYKHTGLMLLLVPVIMLLTNKQTRRLHLRVITAAVCVMITYFVLMELSYGGAFTEATWVQILRAIGQIDSRGLNFDAGTTLRAIYETYWVFVTTVGILALSVPVFIFNLIRWRKGTLGEERLVTAWYFAAGLFLAVVALKAPHYLITLLIPAYLMVIICMYKALRHLTRYEEIRTAITVLATLIVVMNMTTWYYRFIAFKPDNALLDTQKAMQVITAGQANVVVLTEQTIGVELPANCIYWNIQFHDTDPSVLEKVKYVILYTSITQAPPKSQLLDELIQRATLLKTLTGFKETMSIYVLPPALAGQ